MKILYLTPEFQGLAQVGGVGDVARSLPRELRKMGHDVRVVMPYYQQVARQYPDAPCYPGVNVATGIGLLQCAGREVVVDEVPVYLIEHNTFYDRPRLYDDGALSYVDNAERFSFLSMAAIDLCRHLDWIPDVVHANDWTTALAPYFVRAREREPWCHGVATVLTVHNGYFQGKCYADKRKFLNIPDELFCPHIFEDYGHVNFLKAGIHFADEINAVSPTYARELLTPEGAHGLSEALERRRANLRGILNGCDYHHWNPETDDLIAERYSGDDLRGKAACKSDLELRLFGVNRSDRPVFAMVCRLTKQKGFGFALPALCGLVEAGAAVVVLGYGDPHIETELKSLVRQHPGSAAWLAGFDDAWAHRIFSGSDFFLVPSLFEPCGITQMCGLRYGAVPIVRAVGGLRDTVENAADLGQFGTGFVFDEPTSEAFLACLMRALVAYYRDTEQFAQLVRRAMNVRIEWSQAAFEYVEMYRAAMRARGARQR